MPVVSQRVRKQGVQGALPALTDLLLRVTDAFLIGCLPFQIVPVNPANVVKEDADELPAVVVGARSLLPSGIVQATQPRQYTLFASYTHTALFHLAAFA